MTEDSTAHRGRPLGFERQSLDAALMLAFWEHGWSGASYAVLEKQTGVARSSMGNSVGIKADLLAAALRHYLEVVDERLFAPLREGSAGVDDIHDFFVRLREGKRTAPGQWGCLMAIAMTEVGADEPQIARLTRDYRARLGEAMSDALRRAESAGELAAGADSLATALVSMAIGLNVSARAGASDDELDAVVDAVGQLVGSRKGFGRLKS